MTNVREILSFLLGVSVISAVLAFIERTLSRRREFLDDGRDPRAGARNIVASNPAISEEKKKDVIAENKREEKEMAPTQEEKRKRDKEAFLRMRYSECDRKHRVNWDVCYDEHLAWDEDSPGRNSKEFRECITKATEAHDRCYERAREEAYRRFGVG